MADGDTILGSGATPQDGTDASDGGASATAGQGGDGSGALSAEDMVTVNKRIDDLRSSGDRDRDQFKASLAASEARESKLMELLANGGTGGGKQADAAVEQARKELEKQFDDGELTGAKMFSMFDEAMKDARDGALSEASEKLTAAEQERAENREAIAAMRLDLDPAYTSQKEKVDEAVEKYGVTRTQAMKILADAGPSQPPRPAASGGLGTSVVSHDDAGGDPKIAALVAGLAAAVTGRAPSEAEMTKHQAKWSK